MVAALSLRPYTWTIVITPSLRSITPTNPITGVLPFWLLETAW